MSEQTRRLTEEALVGGRKPPKCLVDTGGLAKGDGITHRIPLTHPAGIDDQVRECLPTAYSLDG